MNCRQTSHITRHTRAFTITELIFVVLAVTMLALLFLYRHLEAQAKSARIACAGRHKQISLAHKVFANDHADRFTMHFSTNRGGTMEFVGTGNVAAHYQNMTNELGSPKILVCPDDRDRTMFSDFSTPLSNSNVSYAVGLDADETQPNIILVSDNHMTSSLPRVGAVLDLAASKALGWSPKFHRGGGNVALSDGSVQQMTGSNLLAQVDDALRYAPTNRHRLEFP